MKILFFAAQFLIFIVMVFASSNAAAQEGCSWDPNSNTVTCSRLPGEDQFDWPNFDMAGHGTPGCRGACHGRGGDGNGGGISPAEEQRRATCQAANADWADKECANRRTGNRPRDNSDINFVFPFPDGYDYVYLRGAVRTFQQALWDDISGGVWNNYYDYIGRFYQDCETYAGGVRTISVPICRRNVDVYFGQPIIGHGGYTGFQSSQAAIDAFSSRNGQVCTNLAAVRSQNQCN